MTCHQWSLDLCYEYFNLSRIAPQPENGSSGLRPTYRFPQCTCKCLASFTCTKHLDYTLRSDSNGLQVRRSTDDSIFSPTIAHHLSTIDMSWSSIASERSR